jgi:non-specific serine/threonine protein kinase
VRSLAEKNLVLPEGGMLETIREFAGERLAAGGEESTIRGHHARWHLAMAEEGGPNRRGDERVAWLDRVGYERENLRAALAWAGDSETGLRLAAGLAPFWITHGLLDEGKRSLATVLAGSGEPSVGRARALSAAGFLNMVSGDVEPADRACRNSLTLLPAAESWYRALSLNVVGTAARYRGRWEEARRRYDEALALATAGDLWFPASLAQGNLGVLAGLDDRHAEALDRHEHSLRIAREGGDAWMVPTCLMNTGRAVRRLGDLDRASALQAEALRSFVALENPWGIAACLDAFATLAGDRGHHVRAARLYGAEEAIRERGKIALWPTIRDEHEAGMRATASALGDAAWERARSQGRALPQDEAIAEALRPPIATG